MGFKIYASVAIGVIAIELLWRKLKQVNAEKTSSGSGFVGMQKMMSDLAPSGLSFPKDAEVYETQEDIEVSYLTHHFAPYTGGGNLKLVKGERIIIYKPNSSKPKGVYCGALNYEKIEQLIPGAERNGATYDGYSLYIDTTVINRSFKQVELTPIHYLTADVTLPVAMGPKIIAHICTDAGVWGKGFITAVSKKWRIPEDAYRDWFTNKEVASTTDIQFEKIEAYDRYSNEKKFELGNVQFVNVAPDLWVANIIAQTGTEADEDGTSPIRYVYVTEGLNRVRKFAEKIQGSVHISRNGCRLAGGNWNEIESIIKHQLIAYDIDTSVYDLR